MNEQNKSQHPSKPLRSIEKVVDAELMKEGWTRQQLEEGKLMVKRYEELFAQGYTDDQIDTLWAGKTNQEILSAEVNPNGAKPQASQRRTKKQTVLNTLSQ